MWNRYPNLSKQPNEFIFHGAKFTLHVVGYTFHGVKYTFRAVKRKTDTLFSYFSNSFPHIFITAIITPLR